MSDADAIDGDAIDAREIARASGGRVVAAVLGALSLTYFGFVFAEALKSGTAAKYLPPPIAYFTQIAALFPRAARHSLDYRVEGFFCKERRFEEIDVSPWFPIDADNKENRFYRAMHFFGEQPHRETLRALDEFITSHYAQDRTAGEARGDARFTRGALGGVRFVRVQSAIGEPGGPEPRYEKKPLSTFAADDRKDVYYTPESKRESRCRDGEPRKGVPQTPRVSRDGEPRKGVPQTPPG